ncbi:SemiSWEET family sugar transporter [Spiroplasma endosymbiont of Colias croceus]|uniref:SemiSWEET family sugar transporter n=1 Tax=Spiroplasma endosymbiont of Colias croceus TaxID=3066310 RepID=UPI003BAFFB14
MNKEIIGWLAVAVNSFIFLPQIIKIIKTKRVRDLSFFMLLIQLLYCFLWITYGIFIKNWEVVSLDLIILISTIIILGFKLNIHYKEP